MGLCFLTSFFPLAFCTFSLCPLVLPPDSFTKFSLSMSCFPVKQLYMLIASPLSLSLSHLFSSIVIPSFSSLSSYVKPCKPGNLLVVSLWTFSSFVMSFFWCGFQTTAAYSSLGLTYCVISILAKVRQNFRRNNLHLVYF